MTDAQLSNPLRIQGKPGKTEGVLRCIRGPRDDWFAEKELARFVDTEWTVTTESNRVGLRLANDEVTLERNRDCELPSEGMVAGSVQIPPNGKPVVFMRDHAVTGGYPVIATVVKEDIDIAAQLPPGARVRFELVGEE